MKEEKKETCVGEVGFQGKCGTTVGGKGREVGKEEKARKDFSLEESRIFQGISQYSTFFSKRSRLAREPARKGVRVTFLSPAALF